MKRCTECGNKVYAKGLCQFHYWQERSQINSKRPDRAVQRIIKKSYSKIPPRKKSPSMTDLWLQEFFGFKSQVQLFEFVIEAWPHKCTYTGEKLDKYLNSDRRYHCCAHVLPKGKHPLFKLYPNNVHLVHPEFHRIVDQGTQAERAKHPKWRFDLWDKEVEHMKEEYEQFKKEYLL